MADVSAMIRILLEAPRYQTHTWGAQQLNQGIRGTERRRFIHSEDLQNKRVLDLGCATAAECFWALEQGAHAVCGVDILPGNTQTAQRLAAACSFEDRFSVLCHDLRTGLPSQVLTQTWDTVFSFAVLHHAGQQRFWENVPGATVAYVESGVPCPWDATSLSRNGWRAELLGWAPNNSEDRRKHRGVFRLVKT